MRLRQRGNWDRFSLLYPLYLPSTTLCRKDKLGTAREQFHKCSPSLFCLHFILALSLSNLGVKALIYGNNQCVLPTVSRQIHTMSSP
jgi:hypothetical protein